jgi:hypothetical protein
MLTPREVKKKNGVLFWRGTGSLPIAAGSDGRVTTSTEKTALIDRPLGRCYSP